MANKERIAQLKKELAKFTEKDEARKKVMREQQEIKDLKKQIRKKKYGGLVQTGKNLKIIGKNIGVGAKAVGRGFEKFIGEDPNQKGSKKKVPTVDEILKKLPA